MRGIYSPSERGCEGYRVVSRIDGSRQLGGGAGHTLLAGGGVRLQAGVLGWTQVEVGEERHLSGGRRC